MSSESSNESQNSGNSKDGDSAEGASQQQSGLPITEEQLGSPDKLTIRLLSVMFGVTMLCWVGAKAGCNRRDSPIRTPANLTTAEARHTFKGVALEFSQALVGRRWQLAEQLANEQVGEQVSALAAACQQSEPGCQEIGPIYTRAVVLRRKGKKMLVRTESQSPTGQVVLHLETEKVTGGWLVTYQGSQEAPAAGPATKGDISGTLPSASHVSGTLPAL